MKPKKPVMLLILIIALILTSGVFTACQTTEAAINQTGIQAKAKADSTFTTTMEVNPKVVHVGDEITISGTGFNPGQAVDIMWGTFEGHFKLGEYQDYQEQYFTETSRPLFTTKADGEGGIRYVYRIPEDYGGFHNITARVQGQEVGKTSVEIRPQFEVTPLAGPVGTEITVKATGIGYRKWEDARSINWDNQLVGFFNGVISNGSATARIRASGSPGPHILRIWNGYYPYLNIQQAPTYYLPPEDFTFVTTEGAPAFTNWLADWPEQEYSELEANPGTTGAQGERLEVTPNVGTVGTNLSIHGSGFQAGTVVDFQWEAMRGNRREGWKPITAPLKSLTVGADGAFTQGLVMPDDLGGYHAIVATVDGERVADARVIIQPSVVGFTPTSGHVGTEITLHLKGVGWTELDNIYTMTYDNAFTGYACGFNSGGDVTIHITAVGNRGWHIISLWPSVYQGASLEQFNVPWLDFYNNHPGLPVPAFHFPFKVTE